jgi:hypothetical protein
MLSVPSALQVGRPEAAPEPAAAATPFSTAPAADFVPVEVAPLEPAPPDPPPDLLPRKSERRPRLVVLLEAAVAAVAPMKADIAAAASTGPPPLVRPRALALLVPSSFARMTEVSASAPQPGEAQSRGVPSITVLNQLVERCRVEEEGSIPERPGMTTPLAPWTSVRTPCAEACVRRAAIAMTTE